MKKLFKFGSIGILALSYPMMALAAPDLCGDGIKGVFCRINGILNYIVPVLIALGVVYFVWGVVQYMIGDSEEAKKKGRDSIVFGIIGLTVIVGLWGLVNIVVNTFFIRDRAPDDFDYLLPSGKNRDYVEVPRPPANTQE